MQFLVVAKNMESLLDFSVSPLIFVIRGAYYSLLNVFLGGERVMSLVDILVTFVFGVCLPTLDTYSDLGLAYTLIRPTCRKYKGYIYHEKYLGWSSKFLHQEHALGTGYVEKLTRAKLLFMECPSTKKYVFPERICNSGSSFQYQRRGGSYSWISTLYWIWGDGQQCGNIIDEGHCSEIPIYNETICYELEGNWDSHPNFGLAMLFPVILSTVFTLPQWWRVEGKSKIKNKIVTFILILLQLWPQWKMLQILYLGLIKRDENWKQEKDKLMRNIGYLEPILESVMQVHILLCLRIQNPDLFGGFNSSEFTLFWATLTSSVFSASKGIADFLLNGPCKLVSREGLAGGMLKMGYIFLVINMIASICGKGTVLALLLSHPGPGQTQVGMGILWTSVHVLPQFSFAILVLISSIGVKKTISIILRFPQIVLVPVFSHWTIGPIKSPIRCGKDIFKPLNYRRQKILSVSFWSTWVNILISILSSIIFCAIFDLKAWLYLYFYLSMTVIAILGLIFIQYLDQCKGLCCCFCCQSNCYDVKELTYLDVTDFDNELTKQDIFDELLDSSQSEDVIQFSWMNEICAADVPKNEIKIFEIPRPKIR